MQHGPDASRPPIARRRRPRRHAHRGAGHAFVMNPDLPVVAGADALDRASRVALAYLTSTPAGLAGARPRAGAWLRWRMRLRSACAPRATRSPSALNRGLQSGPATRRHSRGHRAGVGHELVLRHRELGGRDVELLGRVAHRHVARSDGARGARARRRSRDASRRLRSSRQASARGISRSSSSATPARATHRSTCFAISSSQSSNRAGCPLRRHLLRRRLSDRRDERLRGQVLAAVQGRDEAGLRHPRQSRLVRCARSVRRHVPSGRRGASQHPRQGRSRPARHEHDRRPHRGASSSRQSGLRQAYRVPTGFQRGPFFELQTDRFALLAIDTGVLQTIDQRAGCVAAGRRSTRSRASRPWRFSAIRSTRVATTDARRRRRSRASSSCCSVTASRSSMAGDTHDLEYYRERGRAARRHGASLRQRRRRRLSQLRHGAGLAGAPAPTADWAYYPDRRRGHGQDRRIHTVVEATGLVVDAALRRVAIFSAEWLSAAFDYNVAPFFQSFVEVQGRAFGEPRARDSVRRSRTSDLGRAGDVRGSPRRGRARGAGGMGRADVTRGRPALKHAAQQHRR